MIFLAEGVGFKFSLCVANFMAAFFFFLAPSKKNITYDIPLDTEENVKNIPFPHPNLHLVVLRINQKSENHGVIRQIN